MKQQTRLFFIVVIIAFLLLVFAWRYAGDNNQKPTSLEEGWRQEALAAGATTEGADNYAIYREVAERFCILGHLLVASGDLATLPADPDPPKTWLDRHPEARMTVEERARRNRWLVSEDPLREW